jgi:hypothetical protein
MALWAAVLTSVLAWFVGTQVAYRWDEVKRRRELDLAALNDLYESAGGFSLDRVPSSIGLEHGATGGHSVS